MENENNIQTLSDELSSLRKKYNELKEDFNLMIEILEENFKKDTKIKI